MKRALCLAILLSACGARTDLDLDPALRFDAGRRDAGRPRDAYMADAKRCMTQNDCEDGIECTIDRCASGLCTIELDHSQCGEGRFCDGDVCAVGMGCTNMPPPCTDSIACTIDSCNEALDECVHDPRPDLCPISHRCDLTRGCVARALAHDSGTLYEIDLPSGDLTVIGASPVALTDIALHPDGTLYGAADGWLVIVDYISVEVDYVVTVGGAFNALDISPDGEIYGATDDRVVRFDIAGGTATTVARFPGSLITSGDIAFVEGRLYATTSDFTTAGDTLVEVPLDGSGARIVGNLSYGCVWGLAPFGGTLYGLTCDGTLIDIDETTAGVTALVGTGVGFWGAGAR